MAKVHHRCARKDYPDAGISKGDMYYYCNRKTGPRSSVVMRQLTPFRRSQLTGSEFLSALYDIEDTLADCSDIDDLESIVSDLRELGAEQQNKFDNMPEGLQQGEIGQMLETRAVACEAAADEIEGLADEAPDTPEEPGEGQTEEDMADAMEDLRDHALNEAKAVSVDH